MGLTHSRWIYLSIYLVLFVLQVAHKASTRARQRCQSAETRSRRPHVQPFSFISLSTVLLQVSLGRPLFLWPSGVHCRAILVKAVVCWRSMCPIHRRRLRFTWVEMGSISLQVDDLTERPLRPPVSQKKKKKKKNVSVDNKMSVFDLCSEQRRYSVIPEVWFSVL